ncbi:MAG: MBL fold metallo-hydrolase [Actinomycetota bacterium]|nr:MBL fold metallo-hydrolase [Actinomycetota bacterium]
MHRDGEGFVVVRITGTWQQEAWDANRLPPVERVRPGLWSIPVPIPHNPLRYVLVYALELTTGGVALVDAGWDTDEAFDALGRGLEEAGGSLSDVAAVLVTHIHPDHYGLAGRVRDVSGAWIGLHPDDAVLLEGRYGDTDRLLADMTRLLTDSGVPEDKLPDLAFSSMVIKTMVTMAPPDVLLEDGAPVSLPGWDLRTVWTPGHSPGHVCFYSDARRLLLSGDHVLPRITPNISVHTQQFPDPLGDYLASLEKVRSLVADEVLPGHEYRFSGLADRVDAIAAHHQVRLDEIEAVVRDHPGATAWEITERLHWSRPFGELEPFMQRQANGETLAHCVVLVGSGRLRAVEGSPEMPRRFFTALH